MNCSIPEKGLQSCHARSQSTPRSGGINLTTKHNGIKLGFAPTRRTVFSREEAVRFRRLTESRLQELGAQVIGLAGLNEDELLYEPADVPEVLSRFRGAGVDALFVPHCNFGTELAVTNLARRLQVPVLLWGPRDDLPCRRA